jgi:hypothetical protein
MKVWSCRMHDVDDINEWHHISAWTADDAAYEYAKICDASSGGDLFFEHGDWENVDVRLGDDGEIVTFTVEMNYEKVFYAWERKEEKAA